MKQGAATPDQSQFQTDAERDTHAAMAAAIARGEDPLGDDEPVVRTEAEADEANEPTDDKVELDEKAEEQESGDVADQDKADEEEQQVTEQEEPAKEEAPKAEPAKEEPAVEELLEDKPVYATGDVKALRDARAEIETRENAIDEKWVAGEISDEERVKQLRPIRKELDANLAQTIRAETLLEANEQNVRFTQQQSIKRIKMLGKAEASVDYDGDEKARGQFDRALKATIGDPDFAGKSFHEIALEAHRMVKALRGVSEKPAPQLKAVAKLPPERKPPAPPPTLRGLPSAASANTGGGVIEQMARLRGQDYEAAFAKLTPVQKAALLDE